MQHAVQSWTNPMHVWSSRILQTQNQPTVYPICECHPSDSSRACTICYCARGQGQGQGSNFSAAGEGEGGRTSTFVRPVHARSHVGQGRDDSLSRAWGDPATEKARLFCRLTLSEVLNSRGESAQLFTQSVFRRFHSTTRSTCRRRAQWHEVRVDNMDPSSPRTLY